MSTRAEEIQKTLEIEILSGKLPPGSRLEETELSERFECSRTPIREALRQLASEALITMRSRQPATVVALSGRKLLEMFQVMAELEGLCARLAARRATPQQIARLRATQDELRGTLDSSQIDSFYDINRRFHELVYEASQNEFLADQTRSLRNRVSIYRKMVTQKVRRRLDTVEEHEQVIDAIERGDGEAADKAMSAHVNLLGEQMLDLIALFPEPAETAE
ncbi:GntR family transcriptional regulator [Trinickia mobilis]|uniref:GntR family transcriptional regulator n=1 Tax=Trinickia mobilis TaxID=2816356 RepID=UPI001A8EE139|nr:GntR family transcriptional regulator [Trinickia mobilis]